MRFARLATLAVLLWGLGSAAQADFTFRKPLTLDGTQVQGGPHLDFPVLVSLIDPNLRTVASGGGVQSAQGYDVAFRAADGTTVLDWELERYEGTNGTLVAWVRFPGTLGPPDTRIQNGVNTQFYVYYGDSRITCCQTSHGTVWNAAYREVFHLAGTAGNPVDATTNGIGSLINPNGDPTATEARGVLSPAPSHLSPIGGGSLDLMNAPTSPPLPFLPNTDSHLRLADGTLAANTSFTLETWFYLDALDPGYVGIVTKNRDSGLDWIGLFKNDAGGGHLLFSGWQCCNPPTQPGNLDGPALVAGRWYHAVATYDNATTTRRLYVDGVQVSTDVVGALYPDLTNATRVGDDSNGNYVDGRIDEVRLSTVERSADWIATGARNQSCASGSLPAPACTAPLPYTTPFLAAGAQEALAGAVTESDCCKVALTAVGNTFTVTTSDSQMVWDTTEGAGLATFTVEEEAQSGVNRRGDVDKYNVFTMQVNDGTWHFERDASGTMQVLESTPTRTRLRQLYDFTGTLHLDRTWSVYAYPRLAIDETLVNDVNQDIRGAQGVHGKGEATCADQTAGNTFFCAGQASGAGRIWLVTDNQNTYGDMLAILNNNTFFGRAGANGVYEQLFEVGTGTNSYFARVFEPDLLTTIPFADRNLYLFYPRLAGLTSSGTEWQPYANEYRNPDDLAFTVGGGWYDANEGTVSATDEWNEAESAYALDANPASGVSFDLDGGTFTRRKPFFKVRQWRSLAEPSLVTREAANLVNGRDYTADVKPLTRAWSCPDAVCSSNTQRANGGLTGFDEFLISPANNFTIDLSGTNHLYFGSDSKFRGLNVALFTRGADAGGLDLQWEYWNGAVWSNLELVGGFTDQTQNFTRNGTVFWTADPGGWAKRNVLAGNADNLPLFYVRVSLAAGSYTTSPVEGLIKTDILLLQYCSDVAVDFETFTIFAPVPTAVTLLSFEARAALGPTSAPAVELAWSTASELQNLGFHLYRGASPDGPWQRLTAALVPGLGSSPTGQAYAWLDANVAAGARYFYLLEDVDTGGQTTRHGPVEATAGATDGDGEPPGTGDEDSPSGPAPSWHGDPGTPSFRVIERGSGHLVAELMTPGFAAVPAGNGQVEIEIAGFETATEDGALAVPVRGALVDAVAGRRVRLAEVTASEVLSVPGLRLGTVGPPRLVVTKHGVVRPGVSRRARGPAAARGGYSPRQWARIEGTGFQGESKKARLVLSPLRHDPGTGTTVLARRLRVRLEFEGREAGETSLGGSRGRRPPVGKRRASGVVAHLTTKAAGLYRVRFEDVFGTGGGVPLAGLRLSRRGAAVAYHVEPDRALFGPGSSLFFVGGGDLNPNGDAVYELATGQAGLRMKVTSATPSGTPVPLHEARRTFEENRYYQAGLLEASDLWQWDILVSPVSREYPFTLQGVAPSSRPARLRVVLQGASDYETTPDHHLRVLVNGVPVAETTWDGRRERIVDADLPAGLLAEGANDVTLENMADTPAAYSMVFLNRFEIRYPRTGAAEAGVLEGEWFESGAALVAGLDAGAVVVDTTATPTWLTGFEASPSGPRFRAEAGHLYLASAGGSVLSPAVRRVGSAGLRNPGQRADWLLIGPRAFLPAARALVELRQRQGLAARAIALEDVDEEFGHGEAGPEGLAAFLRYAYHSWKRPSPRYVVLLGDSTYDPKDYLKTHVADRVPFRPVLTTYLWTASDPAYAAVNGDDLLPDLTLGRLPAANVAEAEALVTKIVAFESAGRTLSGPAVLVADNADSAGAFEAEADEVASGVLAGRPVRKAYLRDLGAATRGEILSALDGGASFLSYIGHGSTAVWASENVFNSSDPATLQPQAQQPLLLTLNCLNGFFHFPPVDSLAEALMKPADRGAIAALSPSGLSLDAPAHAYHQAVLGEIESGRHPRLGDAVLAAQSVYAESGAFPELLLVFHLFGDPALRLR